MQGPEDSSLNDLGLVLTVPEVAQALRISTRSAYEAIRRGDIPVVKVGRSIRVPRHQLEAILGFEGHGSEATTPPRLQSVKP